MFHEHDVVRLVRDVPADTGARWPGTATSSLPVGAIGTVVAVYGAAYEVEFVADDGSTRALLTLDEADIEGA